MNKVKEFNFDMQRENWIDWAKALGILLVVMGHSLYASKDVTSFIFCHTYAIVLFYKWLFV